MTKMTQREIDNRALLERRLAAKNKPAIAHRSKKTVEVSPVAEVKSFGQVDAALEGRRRGRPPGPEVQMLSIGLPPDLVRRVDAVRVGRTRTETVRVLLEAALKP